MKKLLLALAISAAIPFSTYAAEPVDTEQLSQDAAMREVTRAAGSVPDKPDAEEQQEALRLKMMGEAARNYGVQMGRYNRWLALEEVQNARAIELDQAFMFSKLYLRGGTLQPPVLDVAEDYRAIEDDGKLRRLVDKTYRTLVQARFRNTALSWRDFLLVEDLAKPPLPRESLLPANGSEQDSWKKEMEAGWEEGRGMANDEFDLRLEALQRAFRGMVLYGLLARHGMIEPPKVIERRPGEVLTNDNGDEMLIGTREEIISQDAFFVGQPNRWKPLDYGFPSPGARK
ncbi:type IV secretory system conjugative DNA transfer family protein [Geopseudomonas aromaticivorans]